jgi:glycerate 2-kinase
MGTTGGALPAGLGPRHDRLTRAAYEEVQRAADPAEALAVSWPAELTGAAGMYVLAVGKASWAMAQRAVGLLGRAPAGMMILTTPEDASRPPPLVPGLEVRACDHPLPTVRNTRAAFAAAKFVEGVPAGGTLLLLLSGGGSAYLALPADGILLEDLAGVTRLLQRRGATIRDLNAVRKHIEELKGGRLAERTRAARVEVMVLSDVIGDLLDVIASGPCAPDPTTYTDALDALARAGIPEQDAPAVMNHLARGAAGRVRETPKPGAACFERVRHTIISANAMVIERVAGVLAQMGDAPARVMTRVEGEASVCAREFVNEAAALWRAGAPEETVVLLLGGETTVNVGEASGAGGPSQEFALAGAAALHEAGVPGTLLAYSTDGRDGPTDAAGGVVHSGTVGAMKEAGVDVGAALEMHDSHGALDAVGALIRTGGTGTNLNHVALLVVGPAAGDSGSVP